MQQQEEEEINNNPMLEHFANPELNAFDDGIAEGLNPQEMRKTNSLILRMPGIISKQGIENLMKCFGKITRIHILNTQNKHKNTITAFVDYTKFSEAERAIRSLNSIENSGLGIKAELCYPRNKSNNDHNPPQQQQQQVVEHMNVQEEAAAEAENLFENFTSLDLSQAVSNNENMEKVSQFEYQSNQLKDERAMKQLENLKEIAKKSKWEVNETCDKVVFNSKVMKNFIKFNCNNCNRIAILRDDDEQKYYCSLKCFHKHNNGKDEEDVQKEFDLKLSDKVVVTAIINEKCLFVRHARNDLNLLLENVYRTAKNNLKELEMVPSVDDEVIVRAHGDIFRAKILEIVYADNNDEMEFIVQLTDIGNTAKVEWKDLFEMTMECLKLPQLVTKVVLLNVNVSSINMNVIEYLYHLRANETELTIKSMIMEDDSIFVELKDNSESILVNKKIIELSNVAVEEETSQLGLNEVPYLQSTKGVNKKLFCINKKYLDTENMIWCLEEKFVKDFYEFQKALNEYSKKVDPQKYGALRNELCTMKIKDQCYRGMISEERGDGTPLCMLFDIFEQTKVPIENIFPLPPVFIKNPFYSDSYKIHGFEQFIDEKKEIFKNYIKENDFFVADEVVVEGNDFIIKFNA